MTTTFSKTLAAGIVSAFSLWPALSVAPAAAQDVVVNQGGGDQVTSRDLILPIGKAAVIDLPRNVADVLVSDPTVVEAVVRTPRRVYVMANAPGRANAFFFDRNGEQILDLNIRIEQDAVAIGDLIGKLVPDARVEVDSVNGAVILSGRVDSALEAQRVEDIAARMAGPENVVSMMSIREPGQVMLKVRIVEMQRRLIRQLGIDLNGVARIDNSAFEFAAQNSFAISGSSLGGLSSKISTDGFGNVENLDLALDMFEQNGLVKTLAEPNLTALSGHSANFLAGGEFPVPVAGENGRQSVTFKEFGVRLEFMPNVFSKNRIQLKLLTEVSDVSFATGVSFGVNETVTDSGEVVQTEGYVVPGTTTRNAETTIEMPSGGSFAIAGLLQENITEFIDGVPGIKETPLLGALFRSQEFQSNQTELVIIATPYLVEPTDLANLTDPARGHVSPTVFQSVLLGKLEAAYGVKGSGVSEATLQGPLGFILD
ncbi:type II and III secretion system protein family protein [Parvularcula sp. LCG005]|uniref:type II and III secretion system protein family protein n=1 Tax=Parvularcula sp. LCG005 TaxID=3078805 RepID=UPI0029422A71|nr:type II and III secretion system protein family protein [Parvularcula sp. LCG005]WOI53563.1 type II and III secretion system protein family protein [Parvularcula sp. LCG005]